MCDTATRCEAAQARATLHFTATATLQNPRQTDPNTVSYHNHPNTLHRQKSPNDSYRRQTRQKQYAYLGFRTIEPILQIISYHKTIVNFDTDPVLARFITPRIDKQ